MYFFLAGYSYSFSFSPYFSLGIFFLIGYNVFLISWFDICLLMFIVGFATEKKNFFSYFNVVRLTFSLTASGLCIILILEDYPTSKLKNICLCFLLNRLWLDSLTIKCLIHVYLVRCRVESDCTFTSTCWPSLKK